MLSWTLHQKGSPKEDGAAVAVRHQLYYFGRNTEENNEDHIDVQVFNTVTLLWRKVTPVTSGTGIRHLEVPSRREGHTAVLIEYTVYLWGGRTRVGETNRDYHFCNVLYGFDADANTWFKPQVSGTVPEGRRDHSACVLEKVIFIHGGRIQTGLTNDIYKLDTTTMVWSLINTRGTPPPVSECHSATIIGTKMFVFGGYRGWGDQWAQRHHTRVFDTETNQCMNTPSAQPLPEGRCDHSAFTYNGELYIFGGWNSNHNLNDLWKFNPETFSWKKIEPKGKRPHKMKNMCCCMVGDRIILFGAYNRPGDLYVLDFSPSLKTLCKLAVIQYGLEQSELTHNIRWELAAMTSNSQ